MPQKHGRSLPSSRVPPRLSLVIPAYHEAVLLPRLLDTVDAARQRFAGGPEAVEVIVADNSSTDDTAAIAAARGCRVVTVTRRMIGAARNGGAAVATAPIVCFCDADMQIHRDTFNAIEAALADPRVAGGTTRITMERWSLGIAHAYLSLVPLAWATGFDTGVVFCRRADFDAIGGYDEDRHFAEDVDFLVKLRRLGRTRGARLTRLRGVKAIASVRKFDRYGDWHYLWMMPRLTLGTIRARWSNHPVARRYWYEDR